jgi:catalase
MNTSIDASIPVLTEIILPVTETVDHSAEAGTVTAATTSSSPLPSPPPAAVVQADAEATNVSVPEEHWQTLEQSLKEDVLKHVLARVDFVLEHRVRDNLADVLQTAVEGLAKEIRAGLKNSLEELVTRAVTQEINKVKNSK